MCVCVSTLSVGTHESQKRKSDPLELELQAVLSCPMCVPVAKPRSCERVARALSLCALFLHLQENHLRTSKGVSSSRYNHNDDIPRLGLWLFVMETF